MPKQRKSKNQLEKQRDQSRQRNEEFFIKRDMERDSKDAMARQAALEKLGIAHEFSFENHEAIYSYADYSAPLQMIDASVAPPAVTEYPEYPRSEFSTPPAFNVAVKRNKQSAHDTLLHATASRDALRFRRAQHLFAKISTAISGQPCL
jgi:hypothetical protein